MSAMYGPHDVELAFLDLDNHLVDTGGRLLGYHVKLYRVVTGRMPDEAFIRQANEMIGGEANTVMAALWPSADIKMRAWLLAEFRKIAVADPRPALPIEGVAEELHRLHDRGLRMRILTNRGATSAAIASTILQPNGIDPRLFEAIQPAGTFVSKARAILEVITDSDLRVVSMSGDTPSDIKQGRLADWESNIAVLSYGVAYGNGPTKEDLARAGANGVFDTFVELGQALRPSR